MLEFKSGDIFLAEVEALVNPVNCMGVMGKGLALQFKKKCPANFAYYAEICRNGGLGLGQMLVYDLKTPAKALEQLHLINGDTAPAPSTLKKNVRYVINFPTKNHWREKSRTQSIKAGLESLTEAIKKHNIQSIAIPALGAGEGSLPWDSVKKLIITYMNNLETQVSIYEPQ